MSFRNRLTLFFIVIVIVPMIAVALVLFRLVSDSEQGKGSARLAQAEQAAQGLFGEFQNRGQDAAEKIGADQDLARAIRDDDRAAIQRRLKQLSREAQSKRSLLRLTGQGTFDVGDKTAIAPSGSKLIDSQEKAVGDLTVSTVTADQYVDLVRQVTKLDAIVSTGDQTLASSVEGAEGEGLPIRGDTTIDGRDYQVTGFPAEGFDGERTEVRILADERSLGQGVEGSTLLVGAALVGFLVLAFVFAADRRRDRCRRRSSACWTPRSGSGAGDFAVEVPDRGQRRVRRARQRVQLDGAPARGAAGGAPARARAPAGGDPARRRVVRRAAWTATACSEIVVQTAVDGVGARAAGARRCAAAPTQPIAGGRRARASPTAFQRALHAAEAAVMDAGEVAEIQVGGTTALAAPLRATEGGDRVLGDRLGRARRPRASRRPSASCSAT